MTTQRLPHPKAQINVATYAVLLNTDSDWVSAVEATDLLERSLLTVCGAVWPWSYRPVAFALRRLVKAGLVQERITTYRGKHRSKEERREYRLLKAQTAQARTTRAQGARPQAVQAQAAQAQPAMGLFPTVQPIPPGVARRVRGRDMRG